MTPEEVPPNICPTTGKVKYTSPRKAKMAAGRNRAGDRVSVYLCPFCYKHHLTSQKRRRGE